MMPQMVSMNSGSAKVFSGNLFANRSTTDDTILIGWLTGDEPGWTRKLARSAAHSLWFDLTRMLFPEKCDQVLTLVAKSHPFGETSSNAISTTMIEVTMLADGGCEITGWEGRRAWTIRLDGYEIYRFWAALDVALFPVGW